MKHIFFVLFVSVLTLVACQEEQKQATAPVQAVQKQASSAKATKKLGPPKPGQRERYKHGDQPSVYTYKGYEFQPVPYEITETYKLNRSVSDPSISHKRLFYTEGSRYKGGEGLVLNGQPHGEWTWWHEDKKLQKKQQVTFVSGKKEGIQKSWYWNGQQRAQQEFKDGVRHGNRTTWKEDGGLLGTKYYENGEVVDSQRF